MTQDNRGISRRTVIRGAAWSVPVIAAAVAMPMAAASGNVITNDAANYYWDAEAQGGFTTLVPATGGLKATFSTQISYRADPWVNPPAGASLEVVVVFSSPVTLDPASPLGSWASVPPGGSSATVFTFTKTPPNFGDGLTFNVVGTAPGTLTSTATMRLVNGGTTTWASEPSAQTATIVA
ncbi:hypothetical protein [Microbacterium sp. Se5.02b]|uniref:hypothetical protein n=1 Tax=Microbacterium sp. Se5.02b TaxID=2864103 RepID=UPI001C6938EF|nr:hypothetical protein [Microbacterium sp. Se5.02b]QYM63045.1 hypothetical protein K1X59_11980 [Microbacterium sp. Se5.02b]